MKAVIVIAVVLATGWYGNLLYKRHGLPFAQNSGTYFGSGEKVKCITKDGRVLYGKVPQGTICEKLEPVEGSLTIVPSETFTSYNDEKKVNPRPSAFKCDGRRYCSQMRSCEEATFFLRNCPNTKMDGNKDGTPCEKQWCK